MLDLVTKILAAALGLHALLKFAFFFLLPYAKRRAMLDRAYGERPSATERSDPVLLALTIMIAALMLWRGVEAVSFIAGLWIGGTLIQLYFHHFHDPLRPEHAPPPVVSPIKMMSYAIQAEPQKPWPELAVYAVLMVWMLVMLVAR